MTLDTTGSEKGTELEAVSTLVYRSRASVPLTPGDLSQLTSQARGRNRLELISGLMVYDNDHFFQWLEGPRDNLARVMQSILKDPRHTEIQILDQATSRKRAFADWSLKLATSSAQEFASRDDVLEPPEAILNYLRKSPNSAHAALMKLIPEPVRQRANLVEQIEPFRLSQSTASVLKDVIRSVVLPNLLFRNNQPVSESPPSLVHRRLSELAELLIAEDHTASIELIEELHAIEGSVWPLYSTLFEPAARQLGNLWAEEFCSEFDVSLGLCRIQTAASLLSVHAKPKVKYPARSAAVLIAPLPGELHGLGATLDTEVLWNAGWDPRCEYPADVRSLQDIVATSWFDAVDLSLSAAFQREHRLPQLTNAIAEVRRNSRNPALVIVVGGRIFNEGRASGLDVGADLTSLTSLNLDELISLGIATRDAIMRVA